MRKRLGGALAFPTIVLAAPTAGWRVSASAKIGLESGRPSPSGAGSRCCSRPTMAFAPFGQFYRDDITYYGLAVQFDI